MGIVIPAIGEFRMVISFERAVKTADGSAGQNEDFEPWFTTRAYLKKQSGRRVFEEAYDESVNKYDCLVYWRNELEANLNKDVQVIFEARTFSIEHFNLVDERRKIYKIELTEVR